MIGGGNGVSWQMWNPPAVSGAGPNIVRTHALCQRGSKAIPQKAVAGCATPRRRALIARVAKDWSLRLGAAGPIELVIEPNGQSVEIGLHAYGRNRIEIVVLAPEIVEVIFDLAGEVFYQP